MHNAVNPIASEDRDSRQVWVRMAEAAIEAARLEYLMSVDEVVVALQDADLIDRPLGDRFLREVAQHHQRQPLTATGGPGVPVRPF